MKIGIDIDGVILDYERCCNRKIQRRRNLI
ncbi:unknown [Clostridium sp. CAG:356]|nr:unknown [Clostridium sp. CAG:356]